MKERGKLIAPFTFPIEAGVFPACCLVCVKKKPHKKWKSSREFGCTQPTCFLLNKNEI